ncbi:hypothetical protein Esti_002842 [Eimeria stiedai]
MPHPPPPMAADTHVYYWLPTRLPEGGLPKFDAWKALSFMRRARFLCDNQSVARRLLAQQRLNGSEAKLLMLIVEGVVNYLFRLHKSSPQAPSPSRAAELLGVRYIFFDFLLCLIQLFGPAANPKKWFPRVVEEVPTDNRPSSWRKEAEPMGGLAKRWNRPLSLCLKHKCWLLLVPHVTTLQEALRT